MSTTWTLSQIRQKVRQVTGRLSPNELTNNQLDTYINQYYQYTFPAEVKLEKKHTYYEFLTEANQYVYTLPETVYTNFEPPATLDNLFVDWYQDPAIFFAENPQQYNRLTPWTGDGSTVTFTTTVVAFPIWPDTLVITDNVEVFEDTNQTFSTADINITGSLNGTATINYSTGVISVTFNSAPANGQVIYLSYAQFVAGRPTAVLEYNSQLQFFTVPDTAYRFRIKAYKIVDPLVNATDTPDLNEWGPTIAYGASRDIHTNFGEIEAYQQVTMLYKEQLGYILTRTLQNLLNTRVNPNF